MMKPPLEVDSLGKLTEWLSECGMPQRDCRTDEIGNCDAEIMSDSVIFSVDDRETANNSHRSLIKTVSERLYGLFDERKILVWRIRPELEETIITRFFNSSGNEIDPIVYRENDEIRCVDSGMRNVNFYCRYWTEHA